MSAHILMQGDLELELLRSQTSSTEGVLFIDELDRDDGGRGVGGVALRILDSPVSTYYPSVSFSVGRSALTRHMHRILSSSK